eukprot:3669583-Lingulodinium_polyedra.AAC.1
MLRLMRAHARQAAFHNAAQALGLSARTCKDQRFLASLLAMPLPRLPPNSSSCTMQLHHAKQLGATPATGMPPSSSSCTMQLHHAPCAC